MTKNVSMRNVLSEDIHSLVSNHFCYFLLSLLVLLLAWFPSGQDEFVDWPFDIVLLFVC